MYRTIPPPPIDTSMHNDDDTMEQERNDVASEKKINGTVQPVATPTPSSPLCMNDEEMDESEERCFICGFGGELMVCDFFTCAKVYHRFCLGPYPLSTASGQNWLCPQHACASTGVDDVPPTRKKVRRTPSSAPSPMAVATGTLWKCLSCPVAVSASVMNPVSYIMSLIPRRKRSYKIW